MLSANSSEGSWLYAGPVVQTGGSGSSDSLQTVPGWVVAGTAACGHIPLRYPPKVYAARRRKEVLGGRVPFRRAPPHGPKNHGVYNKYDEAVRGPKRDLLSP